MRASHVKVCSKCGEEKPLDDFQCDRRAQDGRRSDCRLCSAERSRHYYADNAEAAKEYARSYRAENPEAMKERRRRYYADNAEAVKASDRRYYADNAEAMKARSVRYSASEAGKASARRYRASEAGRESARRRGARRRARKLGVPTHDFIRADILARHPRSCCTYCGARLTIDNFQAEHVVPLTPRKGEPQGCHCLANLVPACAACNMRKGNRQPSLDLFIDLWDRAHSLDIAAEVE